ncbi:hypothetical protein [Haloechinothrix halophila]|uniref:hypothetical protein n=1 Tax=Haloechinothrix halophila TaxID=1069073 RepID=UPI0003FCF283|nr:hypothetical protein [Haloechinothrix halophila]
MGEVITDRQVVAVLRPFVRATAPVLDALREADPLGLRARAAEAARRGEHLAELANTPPGLRRRLLNGLSTVKIPGTGAWETMSPDLRTRWWINRVGRVTALLTSVPGLGGALADRLPVQDALGTASQGLLLCAIAGERGVSGHADRVRLLAWVLFERDIDPRIAAGDYPEHDASAEDARTAELTAELGENGEKRGGRRISLKGFAVTLWRLGRSLYAVTEEMEKRPHGRFWHRWLGMLPVVGMLGDYLGERSGLRRVAKRADQWFIRSGLTARTGG